MIERCEFKRIDNQDVLIIHLNFDYEFGNIVNGFANLKEEIKKSVSKIKYKGQKILLMVGGILIGTIMLNSPIKTMKDNLDIDYVNSIIVTDRYEDFANLNQKSIENDNISDINKNNSENDINNNVVENITHTENSTNSNVSKNNDNNYVDNTKKDNVKDEIVDNQEPIHDDLDIDETLEDKQENVEQMVTIYRTNGSVLELSMTDYLIGVVAGEMPASFPIEALKAQSVVARTYALNSINHGKTLTDSTSTQVYKDENQMKQLWGSSYSLYYNKIKDAVTSTNNLAIYYNGTYIDAVYHSTSNGYTEDALNVWGNNVPYLKSVSSYWDQNASSYMKTITKNEADIINLLGLGNLDNIEIIERNESGRVEKIELGDKIYTGIELRNLLGLRSTDFEIIKDNGVVSITTKGYGHGVGMSQYGAKGMAEEGYNFRDILNHYYVGVQIY